MRNSPDYCLGDSLQVSLTEILNVTYSQECVLPANLGQFARSIIMIAVFYQFHVVMRVSRYLLQGIAQPLVSEMADTGRNAFEPMYFNQVTGRPLVSPLHRAQWRMAAAEALAYLAQDLKGLPEIQSSTMKKHCHYISILLHVPMQPMCEYIGWMGTETYIAEARQKLCAWIKHDGENARRAVLHAATLFNLIRRRKSAVYYENHMLFFSSLAIWCFFSLSTIANPGTSSSNPNEEESIICNIDSDEQTDHDIQQAWIAGPGNSSLYIPGVGNLGEPASLRRMLVEAHRILLSDKIWGVNQKFAFVLERLVSRGNAICET